MKISLQAMRTIDSPLGPLWLAAESEGLCALFFNPPADCVFDNALGRDRLQAEAWIERGIAQLGEYFEGRRQEFDLPLVFRGTRFQQRVWEALRQIPFGQTSSYGELAQRVGSPGASRAVGSADAQNPIAIIVPCHRVIGADGDLVGYGGGLERKHWLLRHEGVLCPLFPTPDAPLPPE